MRTFSNLFKIYEFDYHLEIIKVGYRTINIFTTDHEKDQFLRAIFFSKQIRLILMMALNCPGATFYWAERTFVLEDAQLDFIIDGFAEDLIILIDHK